TALAVLPLLFLSFAIIVRGGDEGNTVKALLPFSTPLSALLQGALVAITLFTGFEATPSLSEEVKHARRAIPKATSIVICSVALLYLLVAYASAIGFGLAHVG